MIPDSNFSQTILRLNQVAETFSGWFFRDGMGFGETSAWWKPGERLTPHEGIDLLFFVNQQGETRQLPDGAVVPAAWEGMVTAVFDDFLGSTVMLGHGITDDRGWRLHGIYSHTRPLVGLGEKVLTGQAVATVTEDGATRSKTPPSHLHLSLAWLHPELAPTSLDWPAISGSPMVRLVDPACLLGGAA